VGEVFMRTSTSCRARRFTTAFLGALALTALTVACEAEKPDKLTMMPTGPFKFTKKGVTESVQVVGHVGPKPFTQKLEPTFKSSDETVATVDAKGTITCTGSGAATITASALGVDTTAEVKASIVGGLVVKDDVPRPMKLNSKGHQLSYEVKDDKGTVIADPKVQFRASDYCVEVDETTGFIKPLTEGDCDVIVTIGAFHQRIKLSVLE
jgi:Bacterial Ig-like domain (group 2)